MKRSLSPRAWRFFSAILVVAITACAPSRAQTVDQTDNKGVAQKLGSASESQDEELEYDPVASKAIEDYFEQSFRAAELKGIARTHKTLKRRTEMQGVSLQECQVAWRVDLSVENQPAAVALASIFVDLGVPFVAADAKAQQRLQSRISLRRRKCSRLEAIEAICQEVGVYPDYAALGQGDGGPLLGFMAQALCPPEKGTSAIKPDLSPPENLVVLRVGVRPLPIQFVGPYAIEIAELNEHAPHTTGTMRMRIHQTGLPRDVVAYQEMNERLVVKMDRFADQQQRLLPQGVMSTSAWFDVPGIQSQTHTSTLSGLLRRVESLHVTGKIHLTLPTTVHTLKVESLVAGAETTVGGYQLLVKAIDKTNEEWSEDEHGEPLLLHRLQIELTGELASESASAGHLIPLDDKGRGLRIASNSFSLDSSKYEDNRKILRAHVDVVGQPVALVMKVVEDTETVEFPFEVVAPLQHFRAQLAMLEELKFPGVAPVSVEVLKFQFDPSFSKVQLRWTNHANKAIDSVHYRIHYLNEQGQLLKEWMGALSGFPEMRGGPSIALEKGAGREEEATAFFMPQETAKISISISKVSFADASLWQPTER